jgi:uncharacterized protein YfaT (DUF1175 family)
MTSAVRVLTEHTHAVRKLGQAVAIKLDAMGFKVFAGCITTKGVESLEREGSERLDAFLFDVTKKEHVQQVRLRWSLTVASACAYFVRCTIRACVLIRVSST